MRASVIPQILRGSCVYVGCKRTMIADDDEPSLQFWMLKASGSRAEATDCGSQFKKCGAPAGGVRQKSAATKGKPGKPQVAKRRIKVRFTSKVPWGKHRSMRSLPSRVLRGYRFMSVFAKRASQLAMEDDCAQGAPVWKEPRLIFCERVGGGVMWCFGSYNSGSASLFRILRVWHSRDCCGECCSDVPEIGPQN